LLCICGAFITFFLFMVGLLMCKFTLFLFLFLTYYYFTPINSNNDYYSTSPCLPIQVWLSAKGGSSKGSKSSTVTSYT